MTYCTVKCAISCYCTLLFYYSWFIINQNQLQCNRVFRKEIANVDVESAIRRAWFREHRLHIIRLNFQFFPHWFKVFIKLQILLTITRGNSFEFFLVFLGQRWQEGHWNLELLVSSCSLVLMKCLQGAMPCSFLDKLYKRVAQVTLPECPVFRPWIPAAWHISGIICASLFLPNAWLANFGMPDLVADSKNAYHVQV